MTEPTPATPTEPNGGETPPGFTPPATQQELNRIITDRVNRERAKFADYDELKGKAAQIDEALEKAAQADSALADVPTKVAAELRTHLVGLHAIEKDDADLFLTATDPTLLLKQVERLVGRAPKQGNHVPREGSTPTSGGSQGDEREFVRSLFGNAD